MNNNYEDIINLERPISIKHPPLSMEQRAAQFAPFAALTGFGEQINETGRRTDSKIEIDEDIKIMLNEKLQIIKKELKNKPKIKITYFIKDKIKSGGKYVDIEGIVNKIDECRNKIILENKLEIPIDDILIIECINVNGMPFFDTNEK